MYCELLKKATKGLTGLCTADSCYHCKLWGGMAEQNKQDDKELREKIHSLLRYIVTADSELVTGQILALLQPKPRIDEQALTELAEMLYNFKDAATIESIRGTLESHFLVGTSEHWGELAKKEVEEEMLGVLEKEYPVRVVWQRWQTLKEAQNEK